MPEIVPLFQPRLIWRNQQNPLRGLNVHRAVSALENSERGIYAQLQWTYKFIEKRFEVLKAVIERRISALKKLEWDIKIKAEITEKDPRYPKAHEQQQRLRDAYNGIDNLTEAIEFMAMADFRGYSHLEKHFNPDGDIYHLEPVPQWFWARRHPSLQWLYNWNATDSNSGVEIEYANFVIREVPRPINEPALIRFIRRNLAEKDWDGYLQTYGIPPLFMELPENAPYNASKEYQDLANKVISDGRGTLPSGAKVVTIEPRDRTAPFEAHINHQEEQVVLAATSGKLSVLNDSTGMGSSQPDQHEDTFVELGEAVGKAISELWQRQIDAFILTEPEVYAYFEIAAKDQADVGEIAANVLSLSQAGLEADAGEIGDKVGMKLTRAVVQPPQQFGPDGEPLPSQKPAPAAASEPTNVPISRTKFVKPVPGLEVPPSGDEINDGTVRVNPNQPSKPGSDRGGPDAYPANPPFGKPGAAVPRRVRNRTSPIIKKTQAAVRAAFAADFVTLQNRFKAILDIQDQELKAAKLKAFSEAFPSLLTDLNQNPAAAEALNRGAMSELLAGLEK